jgi:hypothetical protein
MLVDGRSAIINSGFVPGWTSQFYIIPDTGDGIVVLTNSDRGQAVNAEIVADWSAWRGLSALKMMRTYSTVGTVGPIVIALLGLMALWIAFSTATHLIDRRRRVGFANIGHVVRAIALLLPAIGLVLMWFGLLRMIAHFGFPWLELPMSADIAQMGVALVLKAAAPSVSKFVGKPN